MVAVVTEGTIIEGLSDGTGFFEDPVCAYFFGNGGAIPSEFCSDRLKRSLGIQHLSDELPFS